MNARGRQSYFYISLELEVKKAWTKEVSALKGKGGRCDVNDKGLGYWIFVGSNGKKP